MKTVLLALTFCFCPYLVRADTPPTPDIKGWAVLYESRIEIRLFDNAVAYLGLDMEYQNPVDKNEFVQVISRHIPLILSSKKPQDERLFSAATVAFYAQKEEEDRLAEISKKAEPIIYIRWRTKDNPRTGRKDNDGNVDIWFLKSDGEWLFVQNKPIGIQFLSENVGNGKTHNVPAGRKYRVDGMYHILKADRRDLIKLAQGEK